MSPVQPHEHAPQRDDALAPPTRLLDALLANSSEAIVVLDDRGVIQYLTPGAVLLLGYEPSSVLGSSVFSFLHPDDVGAASSLFEQRLDYEGSDFGHEVRVRCAAGSWLPTLVTASLLPASGLGAVALTVRSSDKGDPVQRSLRRRVAVEEYCNRLSGSFMEVHHGDDVRKLIQGSMSEIGLLTGADVVVVYAERHERGILERLARWSGKNNADAAEREQIDQAEFGAAGEAMLEACTHHDDLSLAPSDPVVDLVRSIGTFSLLTMPFSTGSQRGVLVLARNEPGPPWSDADVHLCRRVSALYGKALRAAETEELLGLTYRKGPLAVSIRTWDGALVDCSEQYLKLLGLTRQEARQTRLNDLVHPADQPRVLEQIERLRAGEVEHVTYNMRMVCQDREVRLLRTKAACLQAPGSLEPYVLCALEDVTESHEQRLKLEYAAKHDPLTRAANRAAMVDRIEHLVATEGKSPALLVVDLDRFKLVNDSMGHAVGDQVLCAVVERLRGQVRQEDLVARLGGDEFAIVVAGLDADGARWLAARMRAAFDKPLQLSGRSVSQTISVGVALGEWGLAADELLVRADRALYTSKAKGRNQSVIFDTSMNDEVLERLDMERQLRRGLDNGEFEVHFQPEFEVADLQIVGVEALLRWAHPTRGLVPAADFINVAESTGMIDELGRFALREACGSFATVCSDLGLTDLTLRVNISAREFARPELPDLVRSALHHAGLDPARLCLEMTEMTLMDSPEQALSTFERLHDIGVQFAIDDFGTGYSSLTYLKRFPVDAVKIDRGFVTDLQSEAESQTIVASIINLASALSLQVVAEGIEHRDQLEVLRSLGCARGQGYLISDAMSAIDLNAFLRSRSDAALPASGD